MWDRLLFVLRSALTALLITGAASFVWGALVRSNLRYAPEFPWAVLLMGTFLFYYWRYLNGWGWPVSTSATRQAHLRAPQLSPLLWRWSLLAGWLALAASIVLFLITHRFLQWPQALRANLSAIPVYTLLPSLVMSALVAGISEEAGFRGYMQVSLERRYGAGAAIFITSIV